MLTPLTDWPRTPEQWHAWFVRLDRKFGTDRRSPLHHDNRCPLHSRTAVAA